MTIEPIRLPGSATVGAVLAGLHPGSADMELGRVLTQIFRILVQRRRGRQFLLARDTRTV